MAPRRSSLEQKLARLRAVTEGTPAQAIDELRWALGDSHSYLVGEAAHLTAQLGLHALIPDLCNAFARLCDGSTEDKGATGKRRLIEALLALDAAVPSTYLAGLRIVQREPPGWNDVAAPIRSLCAHALIRIDHPGAVLDIAPLLVDELPEVRSEAARALMYSGIENVAALLHLRVLTGEPDPDVIGACFKGMLRLSPARYLPFVIERLRGTVQSEAESAAIALGESRLPGALPALREALERPGRSRLHDALTLALALHRSAEANEHLISLIAQAPEPLAVSALGSIALNRHDTQVDERVRRTVKERRSKKLTQVLRDKFDD